MKPLPRINGPIFDTGHNFTPDEFPRAWDLTVAEIEVSQGSPSTSDGGFDLALWGCGRVAGADFFDGDATQIALPPSPSLALFLPAALYFVGDEDGTIHRFEPVSRTLLGVPALLDDSVGYLRAVPVEDGAGEMALELFGWETTADAAKVALGFPCVGHVSSGTDAVTDVSNEDATVIWPGPVVREIVSTLRKNLDALDTPITDGDGSGGITPAQFGALQKRVSDLESALADLRAQIGNDSVVGVKETPSSLIINSGKAMAQIVNLDPSSAKHFRAGIDIPDATGDGQILNGLTQGAGHIGGNATYDPETGSIHG